MLFVVSPIAFKASFGIVPPYMTELHIQPRTAEEKVTALREAGKIPAVFYGPKEESTAVTLDAREFQKVWDAVGGSAIVDLVGIGENKEVLIHDVACNPVTGEPIHADFFVIERGKKVNVTVPLVFVGEAPAEKLGGIVTKALHEIEIEVQPRNIPHEIEVDLTRLTDLDSALTIADLNLSDTIEVVGDVEESVVSITLPHEEEEEERTIDDVEIEGEEKDDSDGADSEGEEKSE